MTAINGKSEGRPEWKGPAERRRAREELQRSTYRYLVGKVRRQVLVRVGITAVVLAVLFGALALVYLRRELNESIVRHGKGQLAPLREQIQRLMEKDETVDAEEWQRELGAGQGRAAEYPDGRFVYAAVYDRNRKRMVQMAAQDRQPPETMAVRLNQSPQRFPPAGKVWSRRIAGKEPVCIQLVVEITDAAGQGIGYMEGVYEVNPQVTAVGRRMIWRSVLAVHGIVLLTSMILYPLILHQIRRLTGAVVRLLRSYFEMLTVLSGTIAKRDNDTSEHNFRVTIMAVRLAEAVGIDPAGIRGLFKGALIHEIGKIGEQDAILRKQGSLTETERTEMQKHVIHGAEIVQGSQWLGDGADVVRFHHEKFDGSGYPEGRSGETIPRAARIFCIADVFDALIAWRPYKEPLSLEETLTILRQGRGTHFDPELLDPFLEMAPALYHDFQQASATHLDKAEIESQLVRIACRYFVSPDEAMSF